MVEDLPLPEPFEGFALELGQRDERAVWRKGAVRDERVQVRMEMENLPNVWMAAIMPGLPSWRSSTAR